MPGKPTRTIVPRTAESSARRARPRSTAGRRLEQRVQLRVTAFGDIALLYIVILFCLFRFSLLYPDIQYILVLFVTRFPFFYM